MFILKEYVVSLRKLHQKRQIRDEKDRKRGEQNNTPVESCRDYFCNCMLQLTLENTDLMQKYQVKGV